MDKINVVTVDVDAVKNRLKELGMSREKLARKIGYASVRSVYRMLATGQMSKIAEIKMNEILFNSED